MAAAPDSPIAFLRRVASAAAAGKPLEPADGAWFARCLGNYLADASKGLSMEEAFDMARARGQVAWWTQEQLDRRDELVRRMAAEFFPNLSRPQQAREIAKAGKLYASAGWRRDKGRAGVPPDQRGTLRELLFLACATEHFPLGERQLQEILPNLKNATKPRFSLHGFSG
jgi:hypothetical protein